MGSHFIVGEQPVVTLIGRHTFSRASVHVNSAHAIIKYQHTHYSNMVSASKPATRGATRPYRRIDAEFSGVTTTTVTLAERFFTRFDHSLGDHAVDARCWRSDHHNRDD